MRWRLLSKLSWLLCLLASQLTFGQEFQIDTKKSSVEFEVTHLGVLTVQGSFGKFNGDVRFEKNKMRMSGVIDVSSITTYNTNRDKTIKRQPYLSIETFSEIKFKGEGKRFGDSIKVNGLLTLRGLSHSAQVFCIVSNEGRYPMLTCSTTIKRSDFKLDFGGMDNYN